MSGTLKAQLSRARDQLFPRTSPGCYGKNRYATKHMAELAMGLRQKEVEHALYVYHCGSCDGWHMTKHQQQPKQQVVAPQFRR